MIDAPYFPLTLDAVWTLLAEGVTVGVVLGVVLSWVYLMKGGE